jgi:uncharacterized protein (TIGR04255 family)
LPNGYFTLYFTSDEILEIMTSKLPKPLGGPPPMEIPLAKAPLERVIAQVQFAPIINIDNQAFIADFQEALREQYPLFDVGSEQVLQIEQGPMGQTMTPRQRPVYRFGDIQRNWRISLTSESVALDVKVYSNRDDFLARWSQILEATFQFKPLAVRLGMRYIDRIRDPDVKRVKELINNVYLGPLYPKFDDQVQHMISETALSVEEGNLLLRLGKLPSGGTVDPNVLEPIQGESFIVDIDVSLNLQKKFELTELNETFRKFAERAYTMFRDIVTEEFDLTYGKAK